MYTKQEYRLMKLKSLYTKKWYNTVWLTEEQIWDIAYERQEDFTTTYNLKYFYDSIV